MRFIVDLGCGYLHSCVGLFPFWETLIFGTGDWFVFGEPCFVACLPQLTLRLGTGPCPNHRLSAAGLSYALETINYKQPLQEI